MKKEKEQKPISTIGWMPTSQEELKKWQPVRLRIGDVVTPFFHAKVSDLDPDGRKAAMGYEVPEFLIGMDVIASGLLIVDSMGDDTVLRFTMA